MVMQWARRGVAMLVWFGCAAPASAPPEVSEGAPTAGSWVYRCADDTRFAASFHADSVRLLVEDREVALPRVAAASGARYGAGEVTFWSRGSEATLTTAAATREGCRGEVAETVWAVARLMGNDYRGVGQEPGWLVEIDEDRRIRLLLDYGARRVVTSAPRRASEGATVTYLAPSPVGEIRVEIRDGVCADVMSGEEFPTAVVAIVAGDRYEGCGRLLDGQGESLLTATRWTLVALEGEPVEPVGGATPDLQLTESESRFSGNSGCNRYFGTFARDGESLRFPPPIGTTRRACADPRGTTLERRFLSMLERVDRYSIEEGALVLHAGPAVAARFGRP